MRTRRDDFGGLKPSFLAQVREELTELRARSHRLREDVLGDPELLEHRPSPVALTGIPQLTARNERLFGAGLAREQPSDVIANEQELVSESQDLGAVLHVVEQLIERVDRDRRDTGTFE